MKRYIKNGNPEPYKLGIFFCQETGVYHLYPRTKFILPTMSTILSGRANFYLSLTKLKQYTRQGYNDISLQAFAVQEQDGTQLFIEVRHVNGNNYSYRSDIYDGCAYISTHIVCIDIDNFLLPPRVRLTQVRLFQGTRCIDRWACTGLRESPS